MLKFSESCPKVALKCETKMLGIKWGVWQEKILLLMGIRSNDTLCRIIYEEGKSRDNLVPKFVVKEAIFGHNYSEMKEEVSKMKKLEPIKGDDFREVPEYFMDKSIENGRMAFQLRSQMLKEIPGNFKNKFRNEKEKLICQHCSQDQIMTQSHCVDCPAWTEIKKDLDLSKIEDMVKFFQRLLNERAKRESQKV